MYVCIVRGSFLFRRVGGGSLCYFFACVCLPVTISVFILTCTEERLWFNTVQKQMVF